MKGVSTVIATILMLMITIGLAGVAASYIFGWFAGETAIVLSVEDSECNANEVTVWIRNEGTETSGDVTISFDNIDMTCSVSGLAGGALGSCTDNTLTYTVGYHTIRASTPGATPARTRVYCPVAK